MLHVTDVRPQHGFVLWVRFSDGLEGTVNLRDELEGAVFAPLRDSSFFAQVVVDREIGTVTWPNGADFAPEFLHARLEHVANVR